MQKRRPEKKADSPATANTLRRKADTLGRDLVKLLHEYAHCSERLSRLRHQQGGPLYDLETEQLAVQQAVESKKGLLPERTVRAILRELHSGVRAMVKPLRVAYLGPTYSYSHLAAIERFGTSAELVPVATIAAVFEELNRKQVDYGVVPIENSTDGRIVDTLGMFTRVPTRICGEVQLRIHHYLLSRCERADIKEIYSKPQALSQCRDWLAKHMPLARLVEMTSTASAAQLAAEKPGAAAIASLQAATNYSLNAIAANIEDNKNNITRFAVISDHDGRRTGQDKTALMFEIAHVPGSLADTMAIFKRNRLNLTWIESFPMPNTEKEYLFFVELEGHHEDTKIKRAMEALRRKTKRLEILGAYHRSEPVESP
jgi:chorismate mutase/prephenate dehydratase